MVANCRVVIKLLDLLEECHRLVPVELLLRALVEKRLSAANKALALYWRQHYMFRVCRLGHENIRFFHASASARLRRNHIVVLHDGTVPVNSHQGKEHVLQSFYSDILGVDGASSWSADLSALLLLVTSLGGLDALFTLDEARDVLWQMRADSSTRPDGFAPGFFKAFWPTVKPLWRTSSLCSRRGMPPSRWQTAPMSSSCQRKMLLWPRATSAPSACKIAPLR